MVRRTTGLAHEVAAFPAPKNSLFTITKPSKELGNPKPFLTTTLTPTPSPLFVTSTMGAVLPNSDSLPIERQFEDRIHPIHPFCYNRVVLLLSHLFQPWFLNSQSEFASTMKFVMLNSFDPLLSSGICKSPTPFPVR
jgi:hypothetical protein